MTRFLAGDTWLPTAMKSHRTTTILALTLLALSSSDTVRAASIVKSERWIDRLPQPKGWEAGAVKLKRTTLNHWVRFEAPAVSRRGTLTLSNGTLQFIKSSGLDLATTLRAADFVVKPLALADVEIAGSLMSNIEVASMETGSPGTFTLAKTGELWHAAPVFNQLPFEQSTATDLAISDNLASAIAPNSVSTVASSTSETPTAGQGPVVPVPEPSVMALSALAVTGLLARRRRR